MCSVHNSNSPFGSLLLHLNLILSGFFFYCIIQLRFISLVWLEDITHTNFFSGTGNNFSKGLWIHRKSFLWHKSCYKNSVKKVAVLQLYEEICSWLWRLFLCNGLTKNLLVCFPPFFVIQNYSLQHHATSTNIFNLFFPVVYAKNCKIENTTSIVGESRVPSCL